ncbi:MAG TPA: lipopolysaccharide kinase InaA family protein [Candidatus Binataceae bacterium]|nr:lipopolysaccharide kinase InaA family protein [Candidatus Binataceae bacterium]
MRSVGAERAERDGWSLFFPRGAAGEFGSHEELGALAIDAASGRCGRVMRRSRDATTFLTRLRGDPGTGTEIFFKVIDPPGGWRGIKRRLRGSRAAHVAAISEALRRDGLQAPVVLLFGCEPATGREIISTVRIAGRTLIRWLRQDGRMLERKRAMLRALGAEVARLHRAGYLHGDLTPYNVMVMTGDAPRFAFIDHDRTRKSPAARLLRPRMRNLVQLGRFDLAGLTITDRMRVWRGYAGEFGLRNERAALRRVARMLAARIAREGASGKLHSARLAAADGMREA